MPPCTNASLGDSPRTVPLSTSRSPRWLNGAVFALLAVLACYQTYSCLGWQKTTSWDASMGFLTLRSSLQAGDFNRLHLPTVENLGEDHSVYVTWWTPGQYLVPHWIARVLHMNVGDALRVLAAICGLGGLGGYYLLYTKLGFSRIVAGLAVLVIGSQEYFLKSAQTYLGGDLLLFAFAPFLALVVLSAKSSPVRRMLLVAGLGLVALLLKATGLVLVLALTMYLAFEILEWPDRRLFGSRDWRGLARRLALIGGIFLLFVVFVQLGFFAHGAKISTAVELPDVFERWWGIPVALSGPLYGAFSWLEPYGNRTFYAPMAVVAAALFLTMNPRLEGTQRHDYRRMLVAYYVAFALFFAFAYLKAMGISHEARHFRYAGLLLVPGLLHWLLSWRWPVLVAGAVAALSVAGVVNYDRQHHAAPRTPDSASRWGIRQPLTDASLEAMHRADDTLVTPRTIVFNGFGACPSLLLEFNHGRILPDDNMVNFGFTRRNRDPALLPWYRGEADSIVLLVSKNNRWFFGVPLPDIARSFERPLHLTRYYENEELIIYYGSAR